jgi:type I restriction enzyme M protein
MIGAIIGDTVGSRFEWDNLKSKEFEFFHIDCQFTDDSVMTVAIAKAILECDGDYSNLSEQTVKWMQKLGREYPHAGYGGHFAQWILSKDPQPYNSWGNGAPMRVSAVGWAANSLEEVKELSDAVTRVTHDHPEGLKGAEVTATCIYLARNGKSKDEIFDYAAKQYDLDFTLDSVREGYTFTESSQGTMPVALRAFYESENFEDAIRNGISVGGDSDTIAAITGSIAEAYYGVSPDLREKALEFLKKGVVWYKLQCSLDRVDTISDDAELLEYLGSFTDLEPIVNEFEAKFG